MSGLEPNLDLHLLSLNGQYSLHDIYVVLLLFCGLRQIFRPLLSPSSGLSPSIFSPKLSLADCLVQHDWCAYAMQPLPQTLVFSFLYNSVFSFQFCNLIGLMRIAGFEVQFQARKYQKPMRTEYNNNNYECH